MNHQMRVGKKIEIKLPGCKMREQIKTPTIIDPSIEIIKRPIEYKLEWAKQFNIVWSDHTNTLTLINTVVLYPTEKREIYVDGFVKVHDPRDENFVIKVDKFRSEFFDTIDGNTIVEYTKPNINHKSIAEHKIHECLVNDICPQLPARMYRTAHPIKEIHDTKFGGGTYLISNGAGGPHGIYVEVENRPSIVKEVLYFPGFKISSLKPNQGKIEGNFEIRITGAPLKSDTKRRGVFVEDFLNYVTVGGRLCKDLKYYDERTIGCIVPPGMGKNLKVVVYQSGCIGSSNDVLFSYEAPKIDIVVPHEASQGDEISIFGHSFGSKCSTVKHSFNPKAFPIGKLIFEFPEKVYKPIHFKELNTNSVSSIRLSATVTPYGGNGGIFLLGGHQNFHKSCNSLSIFYKDGEFPRETPGLILRGLCNSVERGSFSILYGRKFTHTKWRTVESYAGTAVKCELDRFFTSHTFNLSAMAYHFTGIGRLNIHGGNFGFGVDNWIISFWLKMPMLTLQDKKNNTEVDTVEIMRYIDKGLAGKCNRYVKLLSTACDPVECNVGRLRLVYADGGSEVTSSIVKTRIKCCEWQHISVARKNGQLRVFVSSINSSAIVLSNEIISLSISGGSSLKYSPATSQIWFGSSPEENSSSGCTHAANIGTLKGLVQDIRIYHTPNSLMNILGSNYLKDITVNTVKAKGMLVDGRIVFRKTNCQGERDDIVAISKPIKKEAPRSFQLDTTLEFVDAYVSSLKRKPVSLRASIYINGKKHEMHPTGVYENPSHFCFNKKKGFGSCSKESILQTMICGGFGTEHDKRCIGKSNSIYSLEMCAKECDKINRSADNKMKYGGGQNLKYCTYISLRNDNIHQSTTHSCRIYFGKLDNGNIDPQCKPTNEDKDFSKNLFEVVDYNIEERCSRCPIGTYLQNKTCRGCSFGHEAVHGMLSNTAGTKQCGDILPASETVDIVGIWNKDELLNKPLLTLGSSSHGSEENIEKFNGSLDRVQIFDSAEMLDHKCLPKVTFGSGKNAVNCTSVSVEANPSSWLPDLYASIPDKPTYRSSRRGCSWMEDTFSCRGKLGYNGSFGPENISCNKFKDAKSCTRESLCVGPASNILRDDECYWSADKNMKPDHFIVLDLGTPFNITHIRIAPHSDNGAPRHIKLFASRSNSKAADSESATWWSKIPSLEAELPDFSKDEKKTIEYPLDKNNIGRLWKLVISSTWGEGDANIRILKMRGVPISVEGNQISEVIRCRIQKTASSKEVPSHLYLKVKVGESCSPSTKFWLKKRSCIPGVWSNWSDCFCHSKDEKTHGLMWRTRQIVLSAENGGVCTDVSEESSSCPAKSCVSKSEKNH